MPIKKCKDCGVEINLPAKHWKSRCEECTRVRNNENARLAYHRNLTEDKKKRNNEYSRWYIKNHKDRSMLTRAKQRAKSIGAEFNLDVEDIIIPDICPVLKVPLKHGTYYTASLDRIDSSKGYVKGNVQVISHKANAMKQNATVEELINFAKWVMEITNKEKETTTEDR